MFTNISWLDFIIAVAILMTIYYLLVFMRYYSEDLKDVVSGKTKLNFGANQPRAATDNDQPSAEENFEQDNAAYEDTEGDEEFEEIEQLIGSLKRVISNAGTAQEFPQDLKHDLQNVLAEYPALKNSLLRSSINELIVSECENTGVALSGAEVDMLW